MNNLIPYLVQSSVSLMVLYAVYWLFLRKDTFFHINRFYLLLALLLSLVIPLFEIRLFYFGSQSPVTILLDTVTITPEKMAKARSGHLTWFEITGVVYITGVAIFTIRFLVQLVQLALITGRNKIVRKEGMNLVFVDKGYSPFSFFNLVFIRKEFYVDGKLTPVLAHERIHIRQFHTIDLLIAEIVTIIQWFNPFAWLLGKSMKRTHEFLADEGVLKEGFIIHDYQTLILNEAMGIQVNNLTNNFNVSLIKNRIQMMTKSRSGAWAVSKVLITAPAIFLLVLFISAGTSGVSFAQEKKENSKSSESYQQEKKIQEKSTQVETMKTASGEEVFTKVDQAPTFPGGQAAMIDFLIKNIKYPDKAKKEFIQGKVFVTFVVETDGSITNVKVLRGVCGGCDEEAVRVIKLMPKWNPGSLKGQPVRVQFNLPIKFTLDSKSDAEKDKAADKEKKPQ